VENAVLANVDRQLETSAAPTLLAPSEIQKMLRERQAMQVVKFRTTCSDCVPSF
jgi:hypothetical protein